MNDYVLLTDSSADLTDALVKELGVEEIGRASCRERV